MSDKNLLTIFFIIIVILLLVILGGLGFVFRAKLIVDSMKDIPDAVAEAEHYKEKYEQALKIIESMQEDLKEFKDSSMKEVESMRSRLLVYKRHDDLFNDVVVSVIPDSFRFNVAKQLLPRVVGDAAASAFFEKVDELARPEIDETMEVIKCAHAENVKDEA